MLSKWEPPDLLLAVMVLFDKYCGSTLHDSTVVIATISVLSQGLVFSVHVYSCHSNWHGCNHAQVIGLAKSEQSSY